MLECLHGHRPDDLNRVTQLVSVDGTSDYTYDDTSQLTAADHDYQTDESYSYDANGNRTMTGYTTGTNNQLTNDGTYSYTYDDEGNRITRTHDTTGYVTEYEWDFRNRLTKVTEKDDMGTTTQVVEYTYDVFNRRIAKAVDTTSAFSMVDAAIERYVYDDLNGVTSIDGGDVVLDFVDPDGDGSTAIDLERRYLYGNAVDQILAQEDTTKTATSADRVLWLLVDNLRTVRDLAKNDATLGEHYKYDSFGQVVSGDTGVTRYLFTSREYDNAIGLQSSRARWYDARISHWMSEDPIKFLAGDTNLVRYVGNAPGNRLDPSGLDWLDTYANAFNGMFGAGYSNTVGGAIYTATTSLGVSNDTLATMSANEALVATTIVSIPIAIGLVAGGEIILGVGTLGGVGAAAEASLIAMTSSAYSAVTQLSTAVGTFLIGGGGGGGVALAGAGGLTVASAPTLTLSTAVVGEVVTATIIMASLVELYEQYNYLDDEITYLTDTLDSITESSIEQMTTPWGIGEGYNVSKTMKMMMEAIDEMATVTAEIFSAGGTIPPPL